MRLVLATWEEAMVWRRAGFSFSRLKTLFLVLRFLFFFVTRLGPGLRRAGPLDTRLTLPRGEEGPTLIRVGSSSFASSRLACSSVSRRTLLCSRLSACGFLVLGSWRQRVAAPSRPGSFL